MSRATVPPDTAAAVRGVLSTPLQTVLSALQDLPPPKHRCAPSAGPGGARFVGGAGHKPQRVVTLNHNCTVADALEMLARHRILSAPVIIQPDPLRADDIHHERLESDDARVEPRRSSAFSISATRFGASWRSSRRRTASRTPPTIPDGTF